MSADLNNIPEFIVALRGYMIEAAINIQKKKDEIEQLTQKGA